MDVKKVQKTKNGRCIVSKPAIVVEGDEYLAVFRLPGGLIKGLPDEQVIMVPVGTPYLCESIRFFLGKAQRNDIQAARRKIFAPFQNLKDIYALYNVRNLGKTYDLKDKQRAHAILRTTDETQKRLAIPGVDISPEYSRNVPKPDPTLDRSIEGNATLVSWFGELVMDRTKAKRLKRQPCKCKVHIQAGLFDRLFGPEQNRGETFKPHDLAQPTDTRIVVITLGEISRTHRVRKAQSYEAIAVDLLRYLRGDGTDSNPTVGGVLDQLSMLDSGAAVRSVLVVRLNNSAVFVYICGREQNAFKELGAWIVCHKKQSAPMEPPELGKMLGYTGFISSHFASVVHEMPAINDGDSDKFIDWVLKSIKMSLAWQRAAFERGILSMLLRFELESREWSVAPNYNRLFDELAEAVGPNIEKARTRADKEVMAIHVDISRAVAHRTPWFMARSSVFEPKITRERNISNEMVESRFLMLAMSWLSEGSEPEKDPVPIVSFCDLHLTDRREVEDFLAIYEALKVYSGSDENRPLNIGVFGSPGAGKSFGVTQVVKYIGGMGDDVFSKGLQFNLGQFKSLNDLPAALHLVRNECLTGKIPVVFFDEFDSTFDGQPFGWLKYLLAPMQDGSFYDNGATYKIGQAVFIFAGGVNRNFEELNGRMRNPGFCEAKGPDFISRLKVHLNLQGVNKPEDDGDQGRYVLRRGILLRSILRARLNIKSEEKDRNLLHPSVAYALLSLERFKHGVRSLESIIKMCTVRDGHPIGPSDLPAMEQMEMHVDAAKLLQLVDSWSPNNPYVQKQACE